MAELKDILSDIVKAIVDIPDEVVVLQTEENSNVTLVLNVAPSDMGKVIGRHGKIARSIRSVMKAAGNAVNRRVTVEIQE